MDVYQSRYGTRTRGGEEEEGKGKGEEGEEEEVNGINSEKVYSTAPSRISGHIGMKICSSMLESVMSLTAMLPYIYISHFHCC